MRNRFYILILVMLFPLIMAAQASGGQIRRSVSTKNTANKVKNQNTSQKKYLPVNMEPNTYYLCINQTLYVENGQAICRKMAAKGYKPELIKSPGSNSFHVCIKREMSTAAAREFIRNFKDDRWHISYVFYNDELMEIVTDGTISINQLKTYSIVFGSSSSLSGAQDLCGISRDKLLFGNIFYDSHLNYYRVIYFTTYSEQEAIEKIKVPYIRQLFPDAWIMKIVNGRAERLSKLY